MVYSSQKENICVSTSRVFNRTKATITVIYIIYIYIYFVFFFGGGVTFARVIHHAVLSFLAFFPPAVCVITFPEVEVKSNVLWVDLRESEAFYAFNR